ncbi:unnamed protein product [Pleuronectes platessa]|uniref:Uncharacterized protein n=1 Tax=Pleuronectes platessa TaxID=8262 RepID=A0A9N7ZBI5_PLEPL|nr:unnamed protein product [Pleuronectes platessa]
MRRRTFQFRRLCTSRRSNAGFTPDAEATPKRGRREAIVSASSLLTSQAPARQGLALTPRFGVASASGVNPASLAGHIVQKKRVIKASYNNKWSLSRLGVVACGAQLGPVLSP